MSGSLKAQRHTLVISLGCASPRPQLAQTPVKCQERQDRKDLFQSQTFFSSDKAESAFTQPGLSKAVRLTFRRNCLLHNHLLFLLFSDELSLLLSKTEPHCGGDRLPLALAVLSLEGGLWQSPHVLGTLLK